MIGQKVLPNGTRVLFEKVEHTQTVSIGFWILHGSRDEEDSVRGYSHFLEHMLFKGTESRSAFELIQAVDRVGGILNAFTEKEQICYYCTLASVHLELAIQILTDMLFHSTLPAEEIEREKLVILNEIKEAEDSPEEIAYDLFLERMWGEHPLAAKITGDKDHIRSITREKLIDFYRRVYVPSNLLISVAGDFDPDRLMCFLEELLPEGSPRTDRKIRENPRVSRSFSTEYVSGGFQQVQIYGGTSFEIPRDITEFYDFLVFSTIFGESMSSRLFQGLRERLGLCYTIYSMRSFFSTTALWIIYANTSPGLLKRLIKGLDDEIRRFRYTPPGNDEIADAVTHLSGGLILSLEDMETRMKRMVRHYLLGGEIHTSEMAISLIERVTRDDVKRMSDKVLSGEDFKLFAYGTRNLGKRKITGLNF
ncbi:MAG: M16 family metallopeptidase [Spirochaetia bacterium]